MRTQSNDSHPYLPDGYEDDDGGFLETPHPYDKWGIFWNLLGYAIMVVAVVCHIVRTIASHPRDFWRRISVRPKGRK